MCLGMCSLYILPGFLKWFVAGAVQTELFIALNCNVHKLFGKCRSICSAKGRGLQIMWCSLRSFFHSEVK